LEFFIDPEQKPAFKLLLRTIFALATCLIILVFTGIEAWDTIILVFKSGLGLGFVDALPISMFLTFFVYGVLVVLDSETILGRYIVVWTLLGLKTLFTMVLISSIF
jgi:hypothetical protein